MASAYAANAFAEQDRAVAGTFDQEARRLRGFIRRRVADIADADDILQDVFSELIEATRLATPIEHVGAWLFRVATNRITDRFRKKTLPLAIEGAGDEDLVAAQLQAAQHGPEASYANALLRDDLEAALAALPAAQREVFIAHELEGRSFKSLAAESGVAVNTLLGRKRYAVLRLRERLQHHQEP
jgi:RNA polymerase sigma factor (sigma-70 family)